jgi:hypothetical protein
MLPEPSMIMQSWILTLESATQEGVNAAANMKESASRLSKKTALASGKSFFSILLAPFLNQCFHKTN